MAQAIESLREQNVEKEWKNRTFFDAIGRPELREILTPTSPWVYVSMEFSGFGLSPNGGLGILAGDIALQAKKLEIPFMAITLLYPQRLTQTLDENFYQGEDSHDVSPEEAGFEKIEETLIRADDNVIPLSIYGKSEGVVSVIGLYEPGLGSLYSGFHDGEHRLYQQSVLGFGGYQAVQGLRVNPPVKQLNEAATAFFALSELDWQVKEGKKREDALDAVRKETVLTNHTLVQATEPWFSMDQARRYVFNNAGGEEVEKWVGEIAETRGGYLRPSDLVILLSGGRNGVSHVHAQTVSEIFTDCYGNRVEFKPVTNGIFLDKWVYPELLGLYKSLGIIDDFDLPGIDFQKRINNLDRQVLRNIKHSARGELRSFLEGRIDQYGKSINLPQDAKIACWAKRFADYKRPGMLFEDPDLLANILEAQNIHVLLAGKAHPTDVVMKREIQRILKIIDNNEILKKRVHFIQDYDENVGQKLVAGVDIWFNTPRTKDEQGNKTSTEACGTSWMKALANLAILISTEDGGVADVYPASYFKVEGNDYQQEVRSLYWSLIQAGRTIDSTDWEDRVKNQLSCYLPVISGARMIKDYLNFFFPPQSLN